MGPDRKNRPEKCIFRYLFPPSLKKICKIFMERNSLRICMFLLRVMTGTQNIHQDFENSHPAAKEDEQQAHWRF